MLPEPANPFLAEELIKERALRHLSPLFANPDEALPHLRKLPVSDTTSPANGWLWLQVPCWARQVVPQTYDGLFLPKFPGANSIDDYPWWRAIDFYIGLVNERRREERSGPVHSYSKALGPLASNAFDFAWVNRIGQFLKCWSAELEGRPVRDLFGELPIPKITLTHDVDAIDMSASLKAKQALSRFLEGQFSTTVRILKSKKEPRFLEKLLDIETSFGWKSVWLIYAKPSAESPRKRHPLDPVYSLDHDRVDWLLTELEARGHQVGVHSSFGSWQNAVLLRAERDAVGKRTQRQPVRVRQHWLRFGTTTTWRAQSAAGFLIDYTLGFNDRPGFRASTALPLVLDNEGMVAIPTVIMDSNLFSRKFRRPEQREATIDHFLDELEKFGGHVAINWHPHTMGDAYGWADTYVSLLSKISRRRIEVVV